MSQKDSSEMLNFLSISSTDPLFADIPQTSRINDLRIERGIEEYDLLRKAESISKKNAAARCVNFLGSGAYRRIIPSVVDTITSMGEFQTAYTPYQPEISQGMLQVLFEYQSIISDLTSMDMTNSSMYDGPTALGEAARMAYRCSQGDELLIPSITYKNRLSVLKNYLAGLPVKIRTYNIDPVTGMIDLQDIESKISEKTFGIVAENPNSLGIMDSNVLKLSGMKKSALLIVYYDPISLGAIKPPGDYGADIAVGEGQQLGIHLNLGGPYVGLFSFSKEYLRKSPGRIIGETSDVNGNRAFVMTVQTREQHIRREKAMSNICSNQALMSLAALSYLSTVGPSGLRTVASKTMKNAKSLIDAFSRKRTGTFEFKHNPFSDVMLKIPIEEETLKTKLHDSCIAGGLSADRLLTYNDKQHYFFSVSEATTEADIEYLVDSIGGN